MIEYRLIKLFKNKNTFDDNICKYQNSLVISNFKHILTYTGDCNKQNVSTKSFLKLNIVKLYFLYNKRNAKVPKKKNKLYKNICKNIVINPVKLQEYKIY